MALDEFGLPKGYPLNPDWEVTPRQVRVMLESEDPVVLIDCRTAQEHAIASIDGATLVPIQELASRLEELREHEDHSMVIFCHHGGRSMQMTSILRQQGFEDVKSMAGGIDLWAQDIEPGMARY